MNERAVLAASAPAAIMGDPGAIVMKAPMVAALVARRLELMIWRPGRIRGREDILPASLRKATIEPVKVIPPAGRVRTTSCACVEEGRKNAPTDQNAEIGCHEMKSCYVREIGHDTSYAGQDCGQTDYGMQGSHGLW